jgi:hypothetical protein
VAYGGSATHSPAGAGPWRCEESRARHLREGGMWGGLRPLLLLCGGTEARACGSGVRRHNSCCAELPRTKHAPSLPSLARSGRVVIPHSPRVSSGGPCLAAAVAPMGATRCRHSSSSFSGLGELDEFSGQHLAVCCDGRAASASGLGMGPPPLVTTNHGKSG